MIHEPFLDWRVRSLRLLSNTCEVLTVESLHLHLSMYYGFICSFCSLMRLTKDFCEHMCFLGSVKYPGENEYKSYLAQHGGHSNASTSMHFTTYKFDVLAEHAEHAIDVFANFFIEPLFTVSGTSREVHAVDSENSKNLSADVRRRLQVLKDIGDSNHYYTKFSTGNAQTIPTQTPEQLESVREALLAFHRKHYRPENLTVVIAGPQSLDQLQDWIVSRFESMKGAPFPLDPANPSTAERLIEHAAMGVPSYHFTAPLVPYQSAFHPDVQKSNGLSWPLLVTNKPIRSMRKLVVMFPVPSIYKAPDQSPTSLLSHLLGHEGPGSSFAVLQNLGWISSLSAGSRVSAPDFTLFQIELTLTIPGEEHWKDVVRVIFLHCKLIAEAAGRMKSNSEEDSNHLSRIWDEKSKLSKMFFQEASPGDVYTFAPSLCNSVVLYGTKNCLAAGSMIHENVSTFPHESFFEFAKVLVPSNCIVERCSEAAWDEMEEKYKCMTKDNDVVKKTEPWYNIDYFVSHVGDVNARHRSGAITSQESNLLRTVQQQLKLPRPNEYIPRSLDLCAELPEDAKVGPRIDKDILPPNLIVNDKQIGRLWHRLDDRYALPKSTLSFLIRNAAVENILAHGVWQYDSVAAVHSSLLDAIFSAALAQETYDATLAGLHWNLSLSTSGIKLNCSGFSDRLPDLALQVLKSFLSTDFIQESFFGAAKDRLERSLRTYFESRRADAHAFYYRDFLLSSVDLGTDQALASLQSVTLESIIAHHDTLLRNNDIKVDCLFSGNIASQEAKAFFTAATNRLIAAQKFELDSSPIWCPGYAEKRLQSGNPVELHFQSKNSQEENGSVVVTFQSSIPGYRGPNLSSTESLNSSAAIRLLCHILREPLFDELRTKQTLGYIVSSYYDIGISSAPASRDCTNWNVPVDYMVISVLSRKLAPPDVLARIDEFLLNFRETLASLSDGEIKKYATSLSSILLKPIQKLNVESAMHFSKIQRYAPEIQGTTLQMPWDNAKIMARTIQSLRHTDIITTWDRLTHPGYSTKIVSCVYGTTFPLLTDQILRSTNPGKAIVVVDNLQEIVNLRTNLPVYDNTVRISSRSLLSFKSLGWLKIPYAVPNTISYVSLGIAATVFGAGMIGWSFLNRPKKNSSS